MKNFLIVVLMVVVGALGYCAYNLNNKLEIQNVEKSKLETKVTEQELQISSLQKTINTIQNTINSETSKEVENKKKVSNEVKFDSRKMKVSAKDQKYTEENDITFDSGVDVEIKDGKVYVTTDTSNDNFKTVFKNGTELSSQEITGFKTDVKEAFTAVIGTQSIDGADIFFIMEDGTVEYVEIKDIVENKNYESKGVINGLENIVKFAVVSVFQENDGGYLSIVAIDEEGYSYDINELL